MNAKGFNMIELMCVVGICAILACLAAPSLLHHNNTLALRSDIANLKYGLMMQPTPLPVDPAWSGSGNVFTKTETMPAGTLTVTAPSTSGGRWSCSFTDPSYILNPTC
jgi:prepilin-type N-terminal cleavage/methylation domain-containing protein